MKTPKNDTGSFPRPVLDGSFPKPEDGGCYPGIGPTGDIRLPLPGAPRSAKPRIAPFFPPYRP